MWGWREGGDRGWEREVGGGGASHLLDGGYGDDEEQREAAGDGAGRGVHDHLVGEGSTRRVRPQHCTHESCSTDSQEVNPGQTGAGGVSLWPFCCSKLNHQVRKTQVFNMRWEVLHSCHELMSMLDLCSSKVALSLIRRTSADFQIAVDAALIMLSLG